MAPVIADRIDGIDGMATVVPIIGPILLAEGIGDVISGQHHYLSLRALHFIKREIQHLRTPRPARTDEMPKEYPTTLSGPV